MATQTQNDPDVVNFAKAIIKQEGSNGDPNAKGASGETGIGQWMPGTWKAQAGSILGDPNAPMTLDNQKAVLYASVKMDKDAGLNPAQIAAKWNSGSPDGWENNIGVNKMGVKYNVPQYVKNVTDYYQQFKSESPNGTVLGESTDEPNLGDKLGGRANDAIDAIGLTTQGEGAGQRAFNIGSGLLQTLGAGAGAIGDVVNSGLGLIPGVKQVEGLIGKGANAVAQTAPAKAAIGAYENWAKAHPTAAGDVGAVGNIATAVPLLRGLGVAKDVVSSGINAGLRGSTDAVVDAVAPKLSAKEAAQAIQNRGLSNNGLLRETRINVDPRIQDVSNTVRSAVPGFNPSAGLVANIKATQEAVTKLASDLKANVIAAGENRIYPKKQLMARLRSIERPDLIASDTTLNNVYDRLISRVSDIADAQGGKVSNLLDLRQDFDALVKRQYPNLYSSDTLSPLRQGVKDIRNAITDFTVESLPEGSGLRESLLTQHKLLTALENMSEKVASGPEKAIGTNVISRFDKRHPIIKRFRKGLVHAAATGLGVKGAEDLLP